MFYNFYIYLVILATMSPILAYNKQKILSKISISEEIFYTTGVLFSLLLIFKLYKKKDIITKVDNQTILRIAIQSCIVLAGLFISGIVISRENVFRYKLFQKPVYIVILLILAVCFYKEKVSFQKLIGIVFLLIGTYLIETKTKIIK